ncbi:MAG: hypothetical protein ACKVUS_01865 [Saprospiraceae bacterium]
MKKSSKLTSNRHATDPQGHPTPDKPPGGGTTPNDPCAIASEQVEYALLLACQSKFNKMAPGCCCDLEPGDQHLPHIDSANDANLLNTASDGSGSVLALGTQDNFWEVATALGGTWAPAVVCNETAGWVSGPIGTSDWISLAQSNGQPEGEYFFRIRFVLCEGIDPKDFVLTAGVLADNSLQEIFVNGIAQGAVPAVSFNNSNSKPVEIKVTGNWRHCVNELVFHVHNLGGPIGFIAQFAADELPAQLPCGECKCEPVELPEVEPCFSVSWGDSDCDCFETNDFEVLCITACNCYSNITFEHLTIHQITVVDEFGNPVPNLPDGMPSVEVIPFGPICFGDLGPCVPGQPSCKSRQVVMRTCGALSGKYRLKFEGICYEICYGGFAEACFEFHLCKD